VLEEEEEEEEEELDEEVAAAAEVEDMVIDSRPFFLAFVQSILR